MQQFIDVSHGMTGIRHHQVVVPGMFRHGPGHRGDGHRKSHKPAQKAKGWRQTKFSYET